MMKMICLKTLFNITHIINELERNIRNHSGATKLNNDYYNFAANYMTNGNNQAISITITDYGKGFENIRKEYKGILTSQDGYLFDEDYIFSAIKPGITTRTNWKTSSEFSKNTGYGLYLLNELASDNKNKLDIYSDGKLYSNTFGDNKLEYMGTYDMSDKLGSNITMINIIFDITTIDSAMDRIDKSKGWKSGKSSAHKSISKEEIESIVSNLK